MNKPTFILMSGPALSGKSTFLSKLTPLVPNIAVVGTDEIRMELYNSYEFKPEREPEIWAITYARVAEALKSGKHAVIDATLRNPKVRAEAFAAVPGYRKMVIAFHHPLLEVLQERNRARTWKSFEPHIVEMLWKSYEFPTPEEQSNWDAFVGVIPHHFDDAVAEAAKLLK
jgi:predicted kinase